MNAATVQEIPAVPDAIEPVHAWRCWSARLVRPADDPARTGAWRLASPARTALWPTDGALQARCDRRLRCHGAPHEGCTCGIWALHDPGYDLVRMGRAGGMPVVGTIAGWGTCIEGERGWRVQYARPTALIIPAYSPLASSQIPTPAELATDLAAYGVPVQVMDATDLTLLLRAGSAGCRAIGAHR